MLGADPASGSSRAVRAGSSAQPQTSSSRSPDRIRLSPSSRPYTQHTQATASSMSHIPSSRLSASPTKPSTPLSSLPTGYGPSGSVAMPSTSFFEPDPSGSSGDIDMGDENDENAPPLMSGEDDEGDDEEGEEGDPEGDDEQSEDEEEVEEVREDEEEEDDEEDDEEEDEDDDARSEDLEGEGEVTFVGESRAAGSTAAGETQVKTEPGEASATDPSAVPLDPSAAGADGEAINTLVPKKKRAKRRSPSVERPPPPPLQTIRLSHPLPAPGTVLEWNVYKTAAEAGLSMRRWHRDDDEEEAAVAPETGLNGTAENGIPHTHEASGQSGRAGAGPSGLQALLGNDDISPEEIARRMEERWGSDTQQPGKKRAAAKRKVVEVYDDEDPFIDDSELQQDAPTHMAQTEKEGFFVHSGVVPLKKADSKVSRPRPSQPRRNPRISQIGPSKSARQRKSLAQLVLGEENKRALNGSARSPIKIDTDGESDAGPSSPYLRTPSPDELEDLAPMPVDRSIFGSAPKDPALLPPWAEFPKEVRQQLRRLREKSLDYGWDPRSKGKFPENIKPLLKDCGRAAFHHGLFELGEEDEAKFFHAMPSVLPYNTFTLTKLSTKLCHDEYQHFLDRCEAVGLEQLNQEIKKARGDAERKYAENLQQYEDAKRKWAEEHPEEVANGSAPASGQAAPNGMDMPIDLSLDNPDDEEDSRPTQGSAPKEPVKRFPFTPEMKDVFTQLLENTQQMVELNKRASDWRIPNARIGREYSELNMRSALYKKVVELFPEGYMTGSILSREMSKIARSKKKSVKKAPQAE